MMASASQIAGDFFQIIGLFVILYGFLMLVIGMQAVNDGRSSLAGGYYAAPKQQSCTASEVKAGACEDLSTQAGIDAAFNMRISTFATWLAAGIALFLIGWGIKAGGRDGGFFAKPRRNEGGVRTPDSWLWREKH